MKKFNYEVVRHKLGLYILAVFTDSGLVHYETLPMTPYY